MGLFDKIRQLAGNDQQASAATENSVHLFYTVGSETVVSESEITEGMVVGDLINKYADTLGMDSYNITKIKESKADKTYSFVTRDSPVVKGARYRFYVTGEEKGLLYL